MLYRPSYCCNCGEKIERDEWRLWTSRRFCALCETEYKPYDLVPRVVVIVALVIGLFGLGVYFRSADPGAGPQLSTSAARPSHKLKPATLSSTPQGNVNEQPSEIIAANAGQEGSQINKQPKTEKSTSDEPVYYCGAMTRKGTPCTRRVKKQGYCWQHAKASQVAPARF